MTKNLLRNALILLSALLLLTLAIIHTISNSTPRTLIGKNVFQNTLDKGLEFNKIELTTSQGKIVLHLKDNYWRVATGSDYYANMPIINNLFNSINKSTYYSKQQQNPELLAQYGLDKKNYASDQQNVAHIRTFADNKLLDDILIGKSADNHLYTYAWHPGSPDIWLITGQFTLPQYQYSWFQQPLFNYPSNIIKSVSSDYGNGTTMAIRLNSDTPFANQEMRPNELKPILAEFNYLIFENVVPSYEFAKETFPMHRRLKVTTFSGLINTLDIYSNGTQYWTEINLSASNLTTGNINAYIDDNKFLFDGWVFELAPESGEALFNTEL